MLELQLAEKTDLDDAMGLIESAKEHLRSLGVDQWQTGYPHAACIGRDIEEKNCYLLLLDGKRVGYLCVSFDGEPSYAGLRGQWKSDQPYAVVHRLALGGDTRLTKHGFSCCGVIWFDSSEKIAFEKLL